MSHKKNFPESHTKKSFIDQVCSVNMAGYWPRFFASLWTLTLSWSINTKGTWPMSSHLDLTYICSVGVSITSINHFSYAKLNNQAVKLGCLIKVLITWKIVGERIEKRIRIRD